MAIVSNWSDPLEASVKRLLKKPDLSLEEIREIEKITELLEGAPVSEDLRKTIDDCMEGLEERYLKAVELTEKYSSVNVIEEGITKLKELGSYKDAPAKIEKAQNKIIKLKKRPVKIMLAAMAVIAVLAAGFAIYWNNENKNTKEQLVSAQQQANAGNNGEAIEILTELDGKGRTAEKFPEMGDVVETVLENTWTKEGGTAAFNLYDSLRDTIPGAFRKDEFYAFADANLFMEPVISPKEKWDLLLRLKESYQTEISDEQQKKIFLDYVASLDEAQIWPAVYKARLDHTVEIPDEMLNNTYQEHLQNVSAETAWDELYTCQDDDMLEKLSEESRSQVENAMLQLLTEELTSEKKRDLSKWAEDNRLMMDQMKADPDIALRFLYALHDHGYDIEKLFPDGVLVDIPIAASVMNLTKNLTIVGQEMQWPDMTTLLPVSVTERNQWEGRAIYRMSESSSHSLIERVEEMQASNDHYDVRLLTQYLYSMDESRLPASYAECESLLCMQNTYLMTSSVYTESKNSIYNSYSNNDYLSSLLGKKTDYKPVFSALDMITVYSISDTRASLCVSAKVNPAQAEDDEWFEAHRTTSGWEDESNMLGVFDRDALKNNYEQIVEESGYIELAVILANSGEMESPEAIGSEETETEGGWNVAD